jgi:hypothetical protein
MVAVDVLGGLRIGIRQLVSTRVHSVPDPAQVTGREAHGLRIDEAPLNIGAGLACALAGGAGIDEAAVPSQVLVEAAASKEQTASEAAHFPFLTFSTWLTAMRYSHVLSLLSPRKPGRAFATFMRISCVASSASAWWKSIRSARLKTQGW